MHSSAYLAGWTVAHGIWSIAEGGPLIPIVTRRDEHGELHLQRMAAEDVGDGAQQALQLLEQPGPSDIASAAVFDAFITLEGVRCDALVTRFLDHPGDDLIQIAVPYTPGTGATNDLDAAVDFRVHPPTVTHFSDRSAGATRALLEQFQAGVDAHPQGSAIWHLHREEQLPTRSTDQPGRPLDDPDPVPEITDGRSPAHYFLDRLDAITGGREPQVYPVEEDESETPQWTPPAGLLYRDWPNPGLLTVFSYGLSEADHTSWTSVRPELCLTARSQDEWLAYATAFLVDVGRGQHRFARGEVIHLGGPVSEARPMEAFVVTDAHALPDDLPPADIGLELPVDFVGFYPIYRSEADFITEHGLAAFENLGWQPYEIDRRPLA